MLVLVILLVNFHEVTNELQSIPDGCVLEEATFYSGEFLVSDSLASDALDCQKHCIENIDCRFYTFYRDQCSLFQSMVDKSNLNGSISGNCDKDAIENYDHYATIANESRSKLIFKFRIQKK